MKLKKWLRHLSFASMAIVFFLSSCGSQTPASDTPVFQSITVSELQEISTDEARINRHNLIDQNNPFDLPISERLEAQVSDLLMEDIVDPMLDYYATAYETVRITINLDNPSNYEIGSFNLNGRRYQSFEFAADSSPTAVTLDFPVQGLFGVQSLKLEQIKYVHLRIIRDVIMPSSVTVNIGIGTTKIPYVYVSDYSLTPATATFEVSVYDEINILEDNANPLLMFLFDGENLLSQPLTPGESTIVFEQLASKTIYQYGIATTLNVLDGRGTIVRFFGTRAFTTTQYLHLEVTSDKTSISYQVEIDRGTETSKLEKVELYQDETLVDSEVNNSSGTFSNLMSNTPYLLEVHYEYQFVNDGPTYQEIEQYEVVTLAKLTPTFSFTSVVPDQEEISFEYTENDADETGSLTRVDLLQGSEIVATLLDFSDPTFYGVLTNNNYTLQATYTYDLNDGGGTHTIVATTTTRTLAKTIPTIAFTSITPDLEQIAFEYEISDVDEVGTLTKIDLFKGNDIVETMTTFADLTFYNTLTDSDYTLKATYTYDLNDGAGPVLLIVQANTRTLIKASPNIGFTVIEPEQEAISFEYEVTDSAGVGALTKIELLKGSEVIETMTSYEDTIFANLLSNTAYKIKATYTYNLNDGFGPRTMVAIAETITKAKLAPEVDIFDESSTETSVTFDIDVLDDDHIGQITLIEIYQDDTLIDTYDFDNDNWPNMFIFSGLIRNTEYTLKVTYIYDLNDGVGIQEAYILYNYPTLVETITVTDITILNPVNPMIGQAISVRITLTNPADIVIRSFVIDGQNISVIDENIKTTADIEFVPLGFKGGVYEVVLEALTYVSYGKVLTQEISSLVSDNIVILGDIQFVNAYNLNDNIVALNHSNYLYLEFDNMTDYDITEVVVNYSRNGQFTYLSHEIEKINQTTFRLEWRGGTSALSSTVSVLSIEYGLPGDDVWNKTFTNSTIFVTVYNDFIRQINSVADLLTLEDGYIYEVMGNLDLSLESWIPRNFNGVILGNGYRIDNLTIAEINENTDDQYYGLFGKLNGYVDDLIINSAILSIETSGYSYVGILAGEFYGLLNDVRATGILTVNSSGARVGGLVGYGHLATVTNSSFGGTVNSPDVAAGLIGEGYTLSFTNSDTSGTVSGHHYVGGFVGIASDTTIIKDSSNRATISGADYVGGFVGIQTGISALSNSFNHGRITGNGSVGGLMGFVREEISINNTYNQGAISGVYHVGGLLGIGLKSINLTQVSNRGAITGNEAIGGLVGNGSDALTLTTSDNRGSISGTTSIGGLIGYANSPTINQSYNQGAISGTNRVGGLIGGSDSLTTMNNSYNLGAVTGSLSVGGLLGIGAGTTNINQSYNGGSVFGLTSIGGLLGQGQTTTIVDSYNEFVVTGQQQVGGLMGIGIGITNIIASNNHGAIAGTESVGGLLGINSAEVIITTSFNDGNVTGTLSVGGLVGYSQIITIDQSYNEGIVSGIYHVGGLAGYSGEHSTLTDSYNNGAVTGMSYVGGLLGSALSESVIDNSYNLGSVSGSYHVGGLLGYGENIVMSASYNAGTVSGEYHVGGLIGYGHTITIIDSSNRGEISGSYNVGGLLGYGRITITIINSYNRGTIDGEYQVGGLIGYARITTSLTNSYNNGFVYGINSVGGLIGYGRSTTTIDNCFNRGSITGSNYVAGLVGNEVGDITITNSENTGTIIVI